MDGNFPVTVSDTEERLRALLEQRILVLDGAMGTMIQLHRLDEDGYRGTRFADWPHPLKGKFFLSHMKKARK